MLFPTNPESSNRFKTRVWVQTHGVSTKITDFLRATQSENKCIIVSFSQQNKQVLSATSLLFVQVIPIKKHFIIFKIFNFETIFLLLEKFHSSHVSTIYTPILWHRTFFPFPINKIFMQIKFASGTKSDFA